MNDYFEAVKAALLGKALTVDTVEALVPDLGVKTDAAEANARSHREDEANQRAQIKALTVKAENHGKIAKRKEDAVRKVRKAKGGS